MLYSTILAGGSGTRLWPLSRACEPKFLHPLTATDRSLLQATVDRIGPLSDAGQIYVVEGLKVTPVHLIYLLSNVRAQLSTDGLVSAPFSRLQ